MTTNTINTQNIIVNNIKNLILLNKKYSKYGYKTYLKNNYIEVIYKNTSYKINAVKHNNCMYWKLKPYKNNYLEIKIDNTIESLEIIFRAISEN